MLIQSVDKWNSFLDFFDSSQKDIYFKEEYVSLYSTEKDKPICFLYQDKENCFLFPYLLRSFYFNNKCYYDFETAYGYGGPIVNTNDENFITEALRAFYNFGQINNYVAGFVRFHPLLNNTSCFNTIGNVIMDRCTVAIDLQQGIDMAWMNEIHTKNRNIIKKGSNNGLQFIADYEYKYLDDFIHLYNGTMNKLSADSFYYFDDKYYENLKNNLCDSFLGVVISEGKIISSAIFFYSQDYGHYHLSGSNKDNLSTCPNNFMLWEAAKELRKHNIRKFHLGGGTNSDEHNSLFEFKKKFSKSAYSFQIGKIIFNSDIYTQLCIDWERNNSEKSHLLKNHLLKYKY